MSIISSPRYRDLYDGREEECLEALRERFLDRVPSKDMFDVYQEALTAGWGLFEVRRAIDTLVAEKAHAAGADPCRIRTIFLSARSAQCLGNHHGRGIFVLD